MILYFSATGNSEYVAKMIGKEIQDDVLNLFDRISNNDYSDIQSDNPWVIVAPTYAWRIPRILHEWIEKTDFKGNKQIYFVMTCGGNIGNAGGYIKKLCANKGMMYMGCMPILMPDNYIALYKTLTQQESLTIINQSEDLINKLAYSIKNREIFLQPILTPKDKMRSSIINDLFYPVYVHAKKFEVTESCVKCGQCEKVCPLKNIHLEHGKPKWGNHCTHCMACICRCPSEAIEYGKQTKGRVRYTCPKNI